MTAKNSKLVYVAGPLTSSGSFMQNIRRAAEAGIRLRELGFTPIVPHVHAYLEAFTNKEEEFWLCWDFDIVKRCDALFRLPGESSGARKEEIVANVNRIPIFRSFTEILEWAGDIE